MIYSIEEIRRIIKPIADKYAIAAVYLFGSYARGDAIDSSDVDILINREGSTIKSLFDLGSLYNDLNETLGKPIDLLTTDGIEQDETQRHTPWFSKNIEKERIIILRKTM